MTVQHGCARCQKALVGNQRKWCSENCRKRAFDDACRRECVDCGALLNVRSGYPQNGRVTERCCSCSYRREGAARRARIEDVAEMYREGMSWRQIARTLGYGPGSTPPEITEARRLGLLDRYRYSPERVANARDALWGREDRAA